MMTARVLIVDDNESLRGTVQDTLVDFDCMFSEAENGEDAINLLRSLSYDVIFLDLKLPDISGIEVLKQARGLHGNLGKVIILTGAPGETSRQEAKELDAFRYLCKTPVDPVEIIQAFSDAIGGVVQEKTNRRTALKEVDVSTGASSLPRLLLLDDNPEWLETASLQLASRFEPTLTSAVEEAYELVERERFDLVILDLGLGATSGLDVLRRMRMKVPTLRAIILTGDPNPQPRLRAGRFGALEYVLKEAVALAGLSDIVQGILDAAPRRVFLSYARTDEARVARLFDEMTRAGLLPWMDLESIQPSRPWATDIQSAVKECDYFVFCASHASLARRKEEGQLRNEVGQALSRQASIPTSPFFIVARLEECPIPADFQHMQCVDLFRQGALDKLMGFLASNALTN